MADKPSRGLVFYGDGLARYIKDGSHIHNLNSFANRAYCGFLSLPLSPFSESEDKRIVREFLELLDAGEDNSNLDGGHNFDKCQITLSERFMGMKFALITNDTGLKSVGGKLGLTVYELSDLLCNAIPTDDDTTSHTLAPKLLRLLGFQEGKALDISPFDMVFVHIAKGEKKGDEVIQFVDKSVGAIMHLADQGSEIGSRLHVSVMMSYGSVQEESDKLKFSILEANSGNNLVFPLLFPQQSYMMKGSKLRGNLRHHSPMLIAQLQDGVTRKDLVKDFSFKDFKEQGAMLTIPADRFIHEVAFKLWKAPKYGA